jgi:hypothetical protein
MLTDRPPKPAKVGGKSKIKCHMKYVMTLRLRGLIKNVIKEREDSRMTRQFGGTIAERKLINAGKAWRNRSD